MLNDGRLPFASDGHVGADGHVDFAVIIAFAVAVAVAVAVALAAFGILLATFSRMLPAKGFNPFGLATLRL